MVVILDSSFGGLPDRLRRAAKRFPVRSRSQPWSILAWAPRALDTSVSNCRCSRAGGICAACICTTHHPMSSSAPLRQSSTPTRISHASTWPQRHRGDAASRTATTETTGCAIQGACAAACATCGACIHSTVLPESAHFTPGMRRPRVWHCATKWSLCSLLHDDDTTLV